MAAWNKNKIAILLLLAALIFTKSGRLEAQPSKQGSAGRAGCSLAILAVVGAISIYGYYSQLPLQQQQQSLPPGQTVTNQFGTGVPDLPSNVQVNENVTGFLTNLRVIGDGHFYGNIKNELRFATTSLEFKDPFDQVVAKAEMQIWSWGTKIDVTDKNGAPIGAFHEELGWWSAFKGYSSYKIFDSAGVEVAHSEKHQLFETEILITDMSGKPVAKLYRPAFQIVDTWQLDIYQKEVVDPRIMLMIPAFKTTIDKSKSD